MNWLFIDNNNNNNANNVDLKGADGEKLINLK
jgi:hypothetical protein